ncbi:MAG: SurA N-terminal domain-containing protein [Candidatus Nomurabacteria bacterium]|jgi:parvulin-like peptidyl-prolyl isomerase|nr:SurA N-terminal domain-containing protein [Candidatus Nomurabacteria bacterium]
MIRDKISKRKAKKVIEETGGRVTNDTVEAHREVILSKARRFKYPLQYTKHKLVINAAIIGIFALAAVCVFGWAQYYQVQNTSSIAYRFSKYLRIPVAEVDGKNVLYSDYLMQYRSNIRAIERQEGKLSNSDDDRRKIDYYKRMALDNSIINTYAMKLADEYDITITRESINDAYQQYMTAGDSKITESGFEKMIEDNFGLTKSEYTRMFIEIPLIRKEVSTRVDLKAKNLVGLVEKEIAANGGDFDSIAKSHAGKVMLEPSGGLVDAQNFDGGRAAKAYALKVGEVSKPFLSTSGDNYYIVKVIAKEEGRVEYSSLGVPLSELKDRVAQLKKDDKVKEYIKLENE